MTQLPGIPGELTPAQLDALVVFLAATMRS
jgi:hypothetical protein